MPNDVLLKWTKTGRGTATPARRVIAGSRGDSFAKVLIPSKYRGREVWITFDSGANAWTVGHMAGEVWPIPAAAIARPCTLSVTVSAEGFEGEAVPLQVWPRDWRRASNGEE